MTKEQIVVQIEELVACLYDEMPMYQQHEIVSEIEGLIKNLKNCL